MDVRSLRAGMLSGAAFALLLFWGMNLMLGSEPDTSDKDTAATTAQKWVAVINSSSHRNKILIGGFVVVLSALALLWFANTLRNRYAASDTPLMAFAIIGLAVPNDYHVVFVASLAFAIIGVALLILIGWAYALKRGWSEVPIEADKI